MTATTTSASAPATVTPGPSTRLRHAAVDTWAVTRRNLTHITRQPQLLVFSTIQPVMFVLLFNFVFGGVIEGVLPPGIPYIDYLIPGIFVQTVAFGSTQTGIGLADDLSKGVIDRFRSLPMTRSAVLAGRTASDLVRNVCVLLIMTVAGVALGFRPGFGLFGAIAIVVALGYAFSWIMAFVGISVSGVETAQAASFIGIFPLVFASSIFTPVEGFPGWLQAIANASPVTHVANAARAMVIGGPIADPLLSGLLWIAGILAVFVPLSVRAYRTRA